MGAPAFIQRAATPATLGAPAPAASGALAFIQRAATPAALGAPAPAASDAPAFIQRVAIPAALGAPAPAVFEHAAALGDLGHFSVYRYLLLLPEVIPRGQQGEL